MIGVLDKTTTFNMLYDFYHPLFNKKQQLFMELYYAEDWSLREIADHFSISRQAVHDRIKRIEKALIEYEQALRLAEKFERRKQLVMDIKKKIKNRVPYTEIEQDFDQLLDID